MTRSGRCADFALLPGAQTHASPSGFNTPAWLVYVLIRAHLPGDTYGETCGFVGVNIVFLCSFSFPQIVFQTLKNCNFLIKVTQPLSSHSFVVLVHIHPLFTSSSLTGYRAGPSFPLIKGFCLYLLLGISAALHSRKVTYGKHCLPHNIVLS